MDKRDRKARHHERRAGRCEHRVSRRERRHRETRDEILDAAREVLLERGAADLSLREIARRAGFSPGALYKYFDSKDDLVKALADAALAALLHELAAVPADAPPDERAVEMGMAYLDFARRNPQDVGIITVHDAAVHAMPLSADHRRLEEIVTGVFADGVARGVFVADEGDDAETMAYGARALVQGLVTFEQSRPPEQAEDLRGRQRRLLQAFVRGLTGGAGEPGRHV